MNHTKAKVSLVHNGARRTKVFHALELVRDDVESKLADQVMLKPNFLTSKNQLASSHVDAIRGAIDFLLTVRNPPDEIIIAEGGNEDTSGEAFRNFGYHDLLEEYTIPIRLVDLNQETNWQETPIILADDSEYQVKMPRTVLDCPCKISVAIAKTHDTCVVTLALKNMIMGTIRKQDRVFMHGFRSHAERKLPDEARALNVNLIRLARYLTPDIAIVDGTRGLQGNGPGGTDAIEFGVVAAGVDVFATDAVVAKTMGFDPMTLALPYYAHQLGLGTVELEQIEILETTIEEVETPFKPHDTVELQMQWQRPDAISLLQPA